MADGATITDLSLDMADFLSEHGVDVICVTSGTFASEGIELQRLTTERVRRLLAEEPAFVSGRTPSTITVGLLDGATIIATYEGSVWY